MGTAGPGEVSYTFTEYDRTNVAQSIRDAIDTALYSSSWMTNPTIQRVNYWGECGVFDDDDDDKPNPISVTVISSGG